jgi:SAM-dependent methyltransferase
MDAPPAADEATRLAVEEAYVEEVLRLMDLVERDDFYGIVAWHGLGFFGGRLGLGPDSHLLDLGSGIGGPARHLARAFGCRVTGIDLSPFNHRVAVERTRAAGLDHLVGFRLGDALATAVPDGSVSHVFGCEAWCYFADKGPLYRLAWRALRPGGRIAFLEAACERPVRLRTAELLGPVHYESVDRYAALLAEAGFVDIERHDTTALATRDITRSLSRLIERRETVIAAAGEEVYYALLELWAEFLAHFGEGTMTHCGLIAARP